MNDYSLFLTCGAVINVPNEKEFNKFVLLMKTLGLVEIKYMEKSYQKNGFENALAYNGGIREFPNSEICIEYRSDGHFTRGDKKGYLKYDSEMKVLTVDALAKATGYENLFIDNTKILYMVIGSGIDEKSGEEYYEHLVITYDEPEAIFQKDKINQSNKKFDHIELIEVQIGTKGKSISKEELEIEPERD